jgi:glycosyltransferase involved in cell wall biosynthesis
MKLLVVCSSLDLRYPFSCTPAWWQLLKALYEEDVDLVVLPYQGKTVESLWWKAEENPSHAAGEMFLRGRNLVRALPGLSSKPGAVSSDESLADKASRTLANKLIRPRWERTLDRILTKEPDFDAVLILTVPANHFRGLPGHLRAKHDVPIIYYDGDVPASLPNFRGFQSGFKIYQGADLSEYDLVISNSQGGGEELKSIGAREVKTLFWGADPDLFAPVAIPKTRDVFFYGHGDEYRREWIEAMVGGPAKLLTDRKFAVRATNIGVDLGPTEFLPYASVSKLRDYACASKINLCIVRGAHASAYASSSSRPFELASMGCCVVSNPYAGLDEWFEPKTEMLTINSAEEAIETYRWLLDNDTEREKIGAAARERVLKEHTYRHRARQLKTMITELAG